MKYWGKYNNILKEVVFLILCLAFISSFLYLSYKVAYPSTDERLQENYTICKIDDISSWNTSVWGKADVVKVDKEVLGSILILEYYTPPPEILFGCNTLIPYTYLQESRVIGIEMAANQEVSVDLAINKDGIGAQWKIGTIGMGESYKKVEVSIDNDNLNKVHWLVGDSNSVSILLRGYNPEYSLIIKIKDIYLR